MGKSIWPIAVGIFLLITPGNHAAVAMGAGSANFYKVENGLTERVEESSPDSVVAPILEYEVLPQGEENPCEGICEAIGGTIFSILVFCFVGFCIALFWAFFDHFRPSNFYK